MKFRKKPVEIEADQWFPGKYVPGVCVSGVCGTGGLAHVHTTHEGQLVILAAGDWVVPESNGNGYYPIKPDIFQNTYELVE